MARVSYSLTDDNRRRLEILTAFGLLDGNSLTRDQIVNESIRLYFLQVYGRYSERADANDFVLRMMKEALSENVQR